MANKEKRLKEERDQIVKGLEKAYEHLVAYKKHKNSPTVIVKDGKIVEIRPEKLMPTTSYKRNGQ